MKIARPGWFLLTNVMFMAALALSYLFRQFLSWRYYVFLFVLYVMLIEDSVIDDEPAGEAKYEVTYYLTAIGFSVVFVVALFEYFVMRRSNSPITMIGVLMCAAAFVFRYYGIKNLGRYFSEHLKIQKGHRIVDTGLYGRIRHPIYMGSILLVVGLPLVLGSYYALSASLLEIVLINIRADVEEREMSKSLMGYAVYMKKTNKFFPFRLNRP